MLAKFLQRTLDDIVDNKRKMRSIDGNHIRTHTFISKNKESVSLCDESGASKSMIGLKKVERRFDKLGRK